MDQHGGQRPTWLQVTISASRAFLTASVLVALYYLMPFELEGSSSSVVVKLVLGLLVFLGLMAWQVREINTSDSPALRALEGLFVALPLFLLVFAATYFIMSRSDGSSFTSELTRTDALYFTVTIFSTVGFGDISAKTESARLVVTGQMMLDLIVLGLGVRIIANVVQRGRDRLSSTAAEESSVPPAVADS